MTTGYDRIRDWRQNTKQKLVEGFSGKCGHCDLLDHHCVYDFHHLDPTHKDFTLTKQIRSWAALVQEAHKCVMLCAPCHRKVHAGVINLRDNIHRFDEALIQSATITSTEPCPVCDGPKPNGQITCSKKCASNRQHKVDWSRFDIIEMYESLGSFVRVAEIVGVSDVSVKKRLRKLGHIS